MTGTAKRGAAPTRRTALAALAGVPAATLAAPALAQAPVVRWRMATSWTKNLPGPGTSAARLAERIARATGGRLIVDLFAAGEIVPAFAVHDAVAKGVVEAGHTASFFLQSRLPAAAFFTTVPFGMGAGDHMAWLEAGGGQALWDELYAPLGLRAFVGGNTGPSMGGWFRREIASVADIKGLRIRVQGLGGELYARLGATPQAIAPGDLYVSLERGTIDAVEFLAPMNDQPLGLHRIAPHTFYPAFNKPNGASEFVVSVEAWNRLPSDLQAALRHACAAEHAAGLADAALANAEALRTLIAEGAKLKQVPADLVRAARAASTDILAGIAAASDIGGRIHRSYEQAADRLGAWNAVSALPRIKG